MVNVLTELAQHVAAGLRRVPKTLSSMYFYDDAGSRLFQQIMALPEYYPTRAEFERKDSFARYEQKSMRKSY